MCITEMYMLTSSSFGDLVYFMQSSALVDEFS